MVFFPFALIDYIKTNNAIDIDFNDFKSETSGIAIEVVNFSKEKTANWNQQFTCGFVIRNTDFDELIKDGGIMDLLENCFGGLNQQSISADFDIFGIDKDEPEFVLNNNYFNFLWKVKFFVKDKRKL